MKKTQLSLFRPFLMLAFVLLMLAACKDNTTNPGDQSVAACEFSPAGGIYDSSVDVLISCPTSGVSIRYTTDGSEPNSASPLYAGPVHLAVSSTLKAKAFKQGWISSSTASADYVLTSIAPPQIDPPGGNYTSAQTVTVTCATAGAEIRYTLDGSDPNENSSLYTAPLTVAASMVMKARAFLAGKNPSEVTQAVFTMRLPDPIFSPAGGYYSTAQMVKISSGRRNVRIHYTTDGSAVTETSPLYTYPINVPVNTVIKAKAYQDGWEPSLEVQEFYIINLADQMQLVPGGSFHNGSSNVTLSPYYIGKREVTELEWVMVMVDMPEIDQELPMTTHDVEGVTYTMNWGKAVIYCNLRSILEGFTPCYNYNNLGVNPASWPDGWDDSVNHELLACDWNANGYRLPTEMEWMYAARGGSYSQDLIYSGSNDLDEVGWYVENGGDGVKPAGTKMPNQLGLYDMSGNLWEYCWDIYHNQYPTADVTDPTGPVSGPHRVMRGGSWNSDASNCTVARRFYSLAALSTNFTGFRVARKA